MRRVVGPLSQIRAERNERRFKYSEARFVLPLLLSMRIRLAQQRAVPVARAALPAHYIKSECLPSALESLHFVSLRFVFRNSRPLRYRACFRLFDDERARARAHVKGIIFCFLTPRAVRSPPI